MQPKKEIDAIDYLMDLERAKIAYDEEREAAGPLPDDDIESSLDIYEYEKRLKNKNVKSSKFSDHENSDDDDDEINILKKSRPQTASSQLRMSRVLDVEQDLKQKHVLKTKTNQPKLQKPKPKFQDDIETLNEELTNPIEKQQKKTSSTLESLEDILKLGESGKDKKYKEILQRCKDLNIQVQKEKSNVSALEKNIKKMDDDYLQAKKLIPNAQNVQQKKNEWESKISALQNKLQEEETKLTNLKIQLNKTVRVLTMECGPFNSIDEILKNENSSKQIVQAIELLKLKVRKNNSNSESSLPQRQDKPKPKSLMGPDRSKETAELKSENIKLSGDVEKKIKKLKIAL